MRRTMRDLRGYQETHVTILFRWTTTDVMPVAITELLTAYLYLQVSWQTIANYVSTKEEGAVCVIFRRPRRNYAINHWGPASAATALFAPWTAIPSSSFSYPPSS
jgi:hypothetical protein